MIRHPLIIAAEKPGDQLQHPGLRSAVQINRSLPVTAAFGNLLFDGIIKRRRFRKGNPGFITNKSRQLRFFPLAELAASAFFMEKVLPDFLVSDFIQDAHMQEKKKEKML